MDVWWSPYLKVVDHFLFIEFEKSNHNILQLFPQTSIGSGPTTIYVKVKSKSYQKLFVYEPNVDIQ
jgi:hypothetical protein